MRYKIKQEKSKLEYKVKFLFFPRYCEKCLTAFWLEMMIFKWTGNWWVTRECPLCGGFLWSIKETAIYYNNKK